MGNKIVLVIGVALAVFLASELFSLHRENTRLREKAVFLTHESIMKGGMTREDWQKIDELTDGQSNSAASRSYDGLKVGEDSMPKTGLRKEEKAQVQTQPVQEGPETPQQKLERLGFSSTEVYQISTKTQKKGE